MFDRGFKTWCENIALQQRRTLGLSSIDPLDPHRIASHLGIAVFKPENVPGLDAGSLRTLLRDDPDSWSAVTVTVDSRSAIVLNSAHTGGRPASDLMHELAHILADHTPARLDITSDGLLILNTFDRQQEEAAAWLAGTLLLPRVALESIYRQRLDPSVASEQYGVSLSMFQYRVRMTGIERQFIRGHGAR